MEFWEWSQPAKKPLKFSLLQLEAKTQESPSFFKKNKRLIIIFLICLLCLTVVKSSSASTCTNQGCTGPSITIPWSSPGFGVVVLDHYNGAILKTGTTDDTSIKFSGLSSSTPYDYIVCSPNCGNGKRIEPQGTKNSTSGGSLSISWKYSVVLWTTPGNMSGGSTVLITTARSVTFNDLEPNHTYSYDVCTADCGTGIAVTGGTLPPTGACTNCSKPNITATVSGLNVNFSWTAQPVAGKVVIWPAASTSACNGSNVNVNSADATASPVIPAGTTTWTWSKAPIGTYVATFATSAGLVGCTSQFDVQTPKVTLNIDTSTLGQAKFTWSDPGIQVALAVWDATSNSCQSLDVNSFTWSKNPAFSGETMSWNEEGGGGKTFLARLVTYAPQPWVSDCMPFTIKSVATPATNLKIASQVCQSDKIVQVHYHWDPAFPAGGIVQAQWIYITQDPNWNNINLQKWTSLGINATDYTTGGAIPNLQKNTPYYWKIVTEISGNLYIAYYKNDETYTSVSCQALLLVDPSNYPNAYIAWTDPAAAGLNVPYYLGVWNTDNNPDSACSKTDGQVSGFPKSYSSGVGTQGFWQQFADGHYKAQLFTMGMIGDNGVSECFPFSVSVFKKTGVESVFGDASVRTGVPIPMIKAIARIEAGPAIFDQSGLGLLYNSNNCVGLCYGPMQLDAGTWNSTIDKYKTGFLDLVNSKILNQLPYINTFNFSTDLEQANTAGIYVGAFRLRNLSDQLGGASKGAGLGQSWTDTGIRGVAFWYNKVPGASCPGVILVDGSCSYDYTDRAVIYYHSY